MRHYVEWITGHRSIIIVLTLLVTAILGSRISTLTVVVDDKKMLPWNHPYTKTTAEIERIFNGNHVAVVGITAKHGDVFQPRVLEKVKRIQDAMSALPLAIKSNFLSLSAVKAKSVSGTADGMVVHRLMEEVPQTKEGLEELRAAVRKMPVYRNVIISEDERTTAVIAQFRDPVGGFIPLMKQLNQIVDHERDDAVEIELGGAPPYLSSLESHAQRIGPLFVLALLITGLIHYEAFRTWQGLVLPLVTALLAVVSALGIMSLASVPLDVFNATTPILILAVAAGHAVQILKRYYEEYQRLITAGAPASKETSRLAVVESVTKIAPVMITAGVVAALGFLSLLVFDIPSIRTFGVFTACGIISALVLEMTFIPALRCVLAPPSPRDQLREAGDTAWGRLSARLAELSIDPRKRRRVFAVALGLAAVCVAASFRIRNDNDLRNYFSYDNEVLVADRALNARLGGTNSFGVLVRGNRADAIKDPKMLRAIEATQNYIDSQPDVGKTLSIVDFIKRMNVALHEDDPAFNKLPDDEQTIAQYLLLYSMSGDPGDFDSYVDYDYQNAHIWLLRKNASTAAFEAFARKLKPFMQQQFAGLADVRLGGNGSRASALNEVMVDGKLRNILQIAIVLFVLCAAVFRSFMAGLMVLVPLVITTIVNFGILGVFGIPLNIATAITTAMGVGIGADYAIYFIVRLREELAKSGDEATAFRKVFSSAGKAVLFVASAVAGGYGVLVLSLGFYMHIWMGILIAAAMLVSAFTALTVLPSLLLTLRPAFVFGNRAQENEHDKQEPIPVDTLA